jgi:chromosome segregation ATPase
LQNYSNYQSICIAHNLDDLAQDVLQNKGHVNGIHSDLESIESHQQTFVEQLRQLSDKLDTIQSAIQDLKEAFDKEKSSPPPILYFELEEQTSFRFFGPTNKQKQLTLKQLSSSSS